jgi:hypothetical protein
MLDAALGRGDVVALPRVLDAPADENVASIIEVLQEHLKLAREGKTAICRRRVGFT